MSGQDGLARAIDQCTSMSTATSCSTLATGTRRSPMHPGRGIDPPRIVPAAPAQRHLRRRGRPVAERPPSPAAAIAGDRAGGMVSYFFSRPPPLGVYSSTGRVGISGGDARRHGTYAHHPSRAPSDRRDRVGIGTVATTASATTVEVGDPEAAVVAELHRRAAQPRHPPSGRGVPRSAAAGNIYETLVTSTRQGADSPGLAELEISEDRLDLVHYPARGRHVPRRRPVTASDVVWSRDQSAARRLEGAPLGDASRRSRRPTTDRRDHPRSRTRLAFHLSRARRCRSSTKAPRDLESSANGTGPFVLDQLDPGLVDPPRAQRRLLGPAGQHRRDHVPATSSIPTPPANALLDGDIDLHTRIEPTSSNSRGQPRLRAVHGPEQSASSPSA